MADTNPNIPIPAAGWVDLYALSGIQIGKQLLVENTGTCDIRIAVSATQPEPDHDAFNILKRGGPTLTNNLGDDGAWAYCANTDGLVNVSALDESGFFPRIADKVTIADESDRSQMVSMAGESHVGFKVDDISVNFQYGISAHDIKEGGEATGTGSVGTDGSMATVSTGTGVGSATIESVNAIRYRAGHETFCSLTGPLAALELNVNQYNGFNDGVDAWSFGSKDLDYGLWFIEGGNVNFIKQSEFNIDKLDGKGPSGYDANLQKGQWFRLSYIWHGFLDLLLEIRTPDGRFIPVHKLVFINIATESHLENPNLPIRVKIERLSGSGENLTIKTGSWRGGTVSGPERPNNADRWFSAFVVNRTLVSGQAHLIAIRSKDIYNGKTNHIQSQVKLIVGTNDSAKTLLFRATQLAVLDPADQALIVAGFVDINTADSVLQVSKAVLPITTPITDAQTGDVAVIQKNGFRDNTSVEGFNIFPGGDVVFITDSDIASGEVSINLNIKELH